MIQRIQSLWLLIASAALGAIFLFPFAKSLKSFGDIYKDQLFNINDHIVLLVLTALGVLISLISIFVFSNRKLQIKLNFLGILIGLALLGVAIGMYTKNQSESESVSLQFGFFLPIAYMIFILLANFAINKDENLVKSSNRLR